MKPKQIFAILTLLSISPFVMISRAADITATNSGNWGDASVWQGGVVPGTNDSADVEAPYNIRVDTNASAQVIYGSGTVTMATDSTLIILGNYATYQLTTLDATAARSTVVYAGNPYYAKRCDYYNLVFSNTNYIDAFPPYLPYQNFNNFSPDAGGPTPMSIAGNMTVIGYTKVQQGSGGADITIGGNLMIGTNCIWDCSGDNLTVVSNVLVYGLLEDLNGALGSNYIGGNLTVAGAGANGWNAATGTGTNGWNVSDVTTWGLGGSLTNNGAIFGAGYGSIFFDGTGIITGTNAITLPTMTVNGTYTIGTTITLFTNTPTLNGTLVFDLVRTNQIVLLTNAGTALYFSGVLNVINSGAPPASGASYKLFNAPSYAGAFASTSFPSLASGLSWIDNTVTSGSIAVTGVIASPPILTLSRTGSVLTLSWDSASFPGYSVQAQTNRLGSNWRPAGSSTTSPFTVTINPTNPPVFFRLSNP